MCATQNQKPLIISKITKDNHVVVEFYADKCVIKDENTQVTLLQGHLKDGLYQLSLLSYTTSHFGPKAKPFPFAQHCLVSTIFAPVNKFVKL